MKQNKKKVMALIVLSIGAVISLTYGILASSKGKPRTSPAHEAIQQEKAPSAGVFIPAKRHAKRSEFASWGRSPFVPPTVPKETKAEALVPQIVPKETKAEVLNLSGIMWHKKNPQALINGAIVGIGGRVGKNTVVNITRESVILNDGARNFRLRLK